MKFFFLFLFSASWTGLHAQSIYHFKYQLPGGKDTTVYESLFVRFSDGAGVMRIKYIPAGRQAENWVDIKMQENYIKDNKGIVTDESQLFYTGIKPRVLKGNPDTGFVAPVIWYRLNQNTNFLEPLAVTRQKSPEGLKPNFLLSELMDTGSLKKSFVLQFYEPDDSFYRNFYVERSKALFLTPAEKETKIHLLIVGNTLETEIGNSCKKDLRLADSTFRGLAKILGIEINVTTISGSEFSKKKVDDAVRALSPVRKRDIVIFYYSGHGFRKDSDSRRFPFLDLSNASNKNWMTESINIKDLYDIIKGKGALLNLVFSDCCNTSPEVTNRKGPRVFWPEDSKGLGWNPENCKTLFLDPTPRSILVTAADIGQRASSNDSLGGFFSFFLRKSFDKNMGQFNKNINWDQILKDAKTMTSQKADRTYCDKKRAFFTVCLQYPLNIIE